MQKTSKKRKFSHIKFIIIFGKFLLTILKLIL